VFYFKLAHKTKHRTFYSIGNITEKMYSPFTNLKKTTIFHNRYFPYFAIIRHGKHLIIDTIKIRHCTAQYSHCCIHCKNLYFSKSFHFNMECEKKSNCSAMIPQKQVYNGFAFTDVDYDAVSNNVLIRWAILLARSFFSC
jgi:hypothetical protein